MKKIILIIALATAAINLFSQEERMYVMKGGTVIYHKAVSDIDSIVFNKLGISDEATLTTDPGVLINGVLWATRNVAAPGHFADNPEDPGMFYQWNSKTGWSSTDPIVSTDESTWNNSWNGNNAAVWETANDPCPAGWRVPTLAEQESLAAAGSEWDTVNGQNGRTFGTAPNTLFLPAAGYRYYIDSALSYAGTNGYYWSSTVTGMNSYYLYFRNSSVTPGTPGTRAYGRSVRCVAE